MKYPVFIQALALTIVVMLIGMYSGILLEQNRYNEVNEYFVDSEVMLIDVMSLNSLLNSNANVSCVDLKEANVRLLNKVYEESIVLDEYETSGRMNSDLLKPVHQKYDVLRSYLWMNAIQIKNRCDSEFNTLVYLYNYSEEDLNKNAEQNVWSKVLYEIKQEKEDDVLLIPIAYDTELITLEALMDNYEIESLPVVIVNEETVFRKLSEKEDVLAVLN